MGTQIIDGALRLAYATAVSSAAVGSRRSAGVSAIVTAFGGRALTLRIKNGATTIATLVTSAGGYAASGPDLVINTIASSTVTTSGTPPSVATFWTLEIVDSGTIKLLCDSVGAVGSSAEIQLSPVVAGFGLGLGVGKKVGMKFRLSRSVDPTIPLTVTVKAAPTAKPSTPLRLGLFFPDGQIANYPQLVYGGTATNAQVHVDSRWPSGCVKMAAALTTQLVSTVDTSITFANRSDPNYVAPTLAALLASFTDFDAAITMRFGAQVDMTGTVSGVTSSHFIDQCSLGAGSTTLASNLQIVMSDSVASWRVDRGRQVIVVPVAGATAGQTSVLKFRTVDGNNNVIGTYTYTYTVLASHVTTYTKSARAMMAAGKARIMRSGPECTVVRICDFITKTEDFGPGSYARPDFWVEFWHGLGVYHLSASVANEDTEKIGTFCASYKVTIGLSSPTTVCNAGAINWQQDSTGGSRVRAWSASIWEPDYGYNIASLRSSGFINHVYALTPAASAITTALSSWGTVASGPGDVGAWTQFMSQTGGRSDIGPYTAQCALWIQSGRADLREICIKQFELAGSWGMFQREGSSTRFFGPRGGPVGVNALGYPCGWQVRRSGCMMSYYSAQNSYWGSSGGQSATLAIDKCVVTGQPFQMGWLQDDQHGPGQNAFVYGLTGDLWALERLQMQAAYMTKTVGAAGCDVSGANTDTTAANSWGGRKNPTYYAYAGDPRGWAWIFRENLYAWMLSSDSDPLKGSSEEVLKDMVVSMAAWNDITSYSSDPAYTWRRSCLTSLAGSDPNSAWYTAANPLHIPVHSNGGLTRVTQPWQHAFVDVVLAMAVRAGFTFAAPLRNWRWTWWKRLSLEGTVSRWLFAEYYINTTPAAATGRPLATVAELETEAAKPTNYDGNAVAYAGYADELTQGYWTMAVAAMTSYSDMPDWDELEDNWLAAQRANWVTGTANTNAYNTQPTAYAVEPML